MKSGSIASESAREKAEVKFHLAERRKSEAQQALNDVRVAKDAESVKTARLRALRLAKEEADRVVAEAAQAAKAAAPKRKARTPKASTAPS